MTRPDPNPEPDMNPLDTTDTARRAEVIGSWSETLAHGSRMALARMDHTLSLAEAKVALVRLMRAERRVAQYAAGGA